MAKPKAKSARRLTLEEIDRIVELKLNQVPVRAIATEVGVAANTVVDHWHKWLDATTEDRREQLERHRSATIARLDHVAVNARRGAIRARTSSGLSEDDRARAEVRYLAEERQALRALSTVAGFDAPIRVTGSFTTMTEEEAAAMLALDDV